MYKTPIIVSVQSKFQPLLLVSCILLIEQVKDGIMFIKRYIVDNIPPSTKSSGTNSPLEIKKSFMNKISIKANNK